MQHRVVVQLDASGTADPIEFGIGGRPDAVIEVVFNPHDDPHCCVKVLSRLQPEGSTHVVAVDNLSSFIVRAAESTGFFTVPPRGVDSSVSRMPSPVRPPSRPVSAHLDLLPQKLFGVGARASIQRTRSNISKASSATASLFSSGRGNASTSTAPSSVSAGGLRSPRSEEPLAKGRSPNGAVWYRQRSQSMRSPEMAQGEQETLHERVVSGMKHSVSDPSIYTDDGASTSQPVDEENGFDRQRMLSASPEPAGYFEHARTPKRAMSTRSTRRPLGPRSLGASLPPSRSTSAQSCQQEDVDGPVPSPPEDIPFARERCDSLGSLTKRPREFDEVPELDRSYKKSARGDVSPGDASARQVSPSPARKRLSSSVGRKERRPRRRRPTVDKASLTPEQLPDILMSEVGGVEENVGTASSISSRRR